MSEQTGGEILENMVQCLVSKKDLQLGVKVHDKAAAEKLLCWIYKNEWPVEGLELTNIAWDSVIVPKEGLAKDINDLLLRHGLVEEKK